ncbi:MAG: DeoR/GlpR family DNA-binding transcription regulator [Planctomycetaceae bacterium]
MLPDARREEILKLIENKGFVSLADLGNRVKASESTIRRDLEYLDGIGQIRRTRGGAAYVGESITSLDERSWKASTEKRRIAEVTAGLIEPHETVLLDGGTTTLEVARRLTGKPLQVVTNSLPIAALLGSQPNVELVVLGGYVYPKTGVALGPITVEALKQIHVRRLIISVGGITENGLYNSNALLVETERGMLNAAEEVIVVSDSSKLGHSALAHLAPLDVVDRLVTDSGIAPEWKTTFEAAGFEVTVVDV